jgi:hypothetical protein
MITTAMAMSTATITDFEAGCEGRGGEEEG